MRLLLLLPFLLLLMGDAVSQQLPLWVQALDRQFAAHYHRYPQAKRGDFDLPDSPMYRQELESAVRLPSNAICLYDSLFTSLHPDSLDLNNLRVTCFTVPGFQPETIGCTQVTVIKTMEVVSLEYTAFYAPGHIVICRAVNENRSYELPSFGLRALLNRFFPLTPADSTTPAVSPPALESKPALLPSRALPIYYRYLPALAADGLHPLFSADTFSHPQGLQMAKTVAVRYFRQATDIAYIPIAKGSSKGLIVGYYLFVQYQPFAAQHGNAYYSTGYLTRTDSTEWEFTVKGNPTNGYAIIQLDRVQPTAAGSRKSANQIKLEEQLEQALAKAFALVPDPHRH